MKNDCELKCNQDLWAGGRPRNVSGTLPVVERARMPQPTAAGGHPAVGRRATVPPNPLYLTGERRELTGRV